MGLKLLFIGGGRRVKLLRLFKEAVGPTGRIYTTDTERLPATKFVADATFTVPSCHRTQKFVRRVVHLCQTYDISCIIPLITPAVMSTIPLRQQLDTLILSGVDEAIRICTDKHRTQNFFKKQGVSYPQGFCEPVASDVPLVARPRYGDGSRGVFFLRTIDEFHACRSLIARQDYVFTRYVEGQEFSIDCYKDLDGDLVSIVPRRRLEVRAGEVSRAVTCRHEKVEADVRHLLAELSFIGPATVQCIMNGGTAYFTEINLRYGGGVTLSFEAGAPSYMWLVEQLSDGTSPSCSSIQDALYFVRYDEEFVFSEEDIFKSDNEICVD